MNILSKFIANILFNGIADDVDKAARKLHNEIVWTGKDDERVEQIIKECKEEGHRQFLAESNGKGRGWIPFSYHNN